MRSSHSSQSRSVGRGRGGPSSSIHYPEPIVSSGSKIGSNSRGPALPSGRGRGVSNQPAWLQQHRPTSSETNHVLNSTSGKAAEKGYSSSARINSRTKQPQQQHYRPQKNPQRHLKSGEDSNRPSFISAQTTSATIKKTISERNDEENKKLLLNVTTHSDDADHRNLQGEEGNHETAEEEVSVEDIEKVAEQFMRNFDEDADYDYTEQQLKRDREERKRRIQQQHAQLQQNGEKDVVYEEETLSTAKRARGLDDASTDLVSTKDKIYTTSNGSQSSLEGEIQDGINMDQKEQTDDIPDGKNSDDDDDMFFDMFADDDKHQIDKLQAKIMHNRQQPQQHNVNTDAANYDDAEGYYRPTIGEYMGPLGQYRVLGNTGKGVFSTVIKCIDVSVEDDGDNIDNGKQQQQHKVVAIKLIRNNETMAKAAVKELRILRMLKSNNTTGGNTFCVELLDKFEHLNHTTFVFEYLDLNLRETLHKFGRNVGIAIAAVRTYTKQLLCALQHLANHGVVHADIKPDNILVSANYGMVKLCDFGSAFLESEYMETDPTPYLVSRFYRPPEVILGLEYDKSIDLWSLAVTLAELFTGSVLFPGNTNNDMLRRFMDCLGPFSNKMLRRHFLSYQKLKLQPHFDPEDYRFKQQTFDKVTGKPVIQHVHVSELRSTSSKKQLVQVLLKAKSSSDDHGTVLKFSDLLGRCLALDPHKRISIHDALSHDFISAAAKLAVVKIHL